MRNSSSEWFSNWFNSHYYHLLYRHRNYEEAELFIYKLLEYIKLLPPANCLDLACGKGRHTKVLADRGFFCIGLDISPNSIAKANEMRLSNARFFVHDMRDPIPTKDLDAVFNLFTSFGYFQESGQDQKVLENVYECIKPGGYFVQDYLNPLPVLPMLPKEETIEIEEVKFKMTKRVEGDFIKKCIEIEDPKNNYTGNFNEEVKIIEAKTLRAMHEKAGFGIVEIFGNYQLEPFSEQVSPRIVVISQRTEP